MMPVQFIRKVLPVKRDLNQDIFAEKRKEKKMCFFVPHIGNLSRPLDTSLLSFYEIISVDKSKSLLIVLCKA